MRKCVARFTRTCIGKEEEEYLHRVKLDVPNPTTEKDKMTSRSHKEKKTGREREGTA